MVGEITKKQWIAFSVLMSLKWHINVSFSKKKFKNEDERSSFPAIIYRRRGCPNAMKITYLPKEKVISFIVSGLDDGHEHFQKTERLEDAIYIADVWSDIYFRKTKI